MRLAYAPEELESLIESASGAGFSVWIGATGDRAMDAAVQALETASSGQSFRAAMPRVIGGDLIPPDAVEKLRGFVTDQEARITYIRDNRVELEISSEQVAPQRRRARQFARDS